MHSKTDPPATERLNAPIDYELFSFALGLFQAAAAGRMQGPQIPFPVQDDDALRSVPVRRGMMAVLHQTGHLSREERARLMLRILHFDDTLEAALADPRFDEHLEPSDDERSVLMSQAFLNAAAGCRFRVLDGKARADMDHLYLLTETHEGVKRPS